MKFSHFGILFGLLLLIIGCGNSTDNQKIVIESVNDKLTVIEVTDKATPLKDTSENISLPDNRQLPSSLIPEGFIIYDKIQGDLNKDGLMDSVFIIKDTKIDAISVDKYRGELDLNRRGLMIFLNEKEEWKTVAQNLSCFYSEDEDGGVYYVPDIEVIVSKGNLYVDFNHGRYGSWQYTFRLKDSDFELIGYDASQNYGPIINSETSINFLTKRMLERENKNAYKEDAELLEEDFEDTWSDIELDQTIKLSEIKDFEDLDMYSY